MDEGERAEDGRVVVKPTEPPTFGHGSPEEQYLRSHLDYLTSGPGGLVAVLARAIYGLLLNMLFLSVTILVPGIILGWLYGWAIPNLRYKVGAQGAKCAASAHHLCFTSYHGPAAIWITAAVFALLGLGVPYLLEYIRGNLSSVPPLQSGKGTTQKVGSRQTNTALAIGTFTGLSGLVATTAGMVRKLLTAPTELEKSTGGRLRQFAAKHRGLLLSIGAAISVPLFAVVLMILALDWGAAHAPFALGTGSPWENLAWAIPALILWWVLFFLADVNTWSLHPPYKQHLSQAFALARTQEAKADEATVLDRLSGLIQQAAAQDSPGRLPRRTEGRPFESADPVRGGTKERDTIQAVAISTPELSKGSDLCDRQRQRSRQGPNRGSCAALHFLRQEVTIPSQGIAMRTVDYQELAEYRVTMPTAMAISGAALSPEMGSMTRRPLRMLITMANIRLTSRRSPRSYVCTRETGLPCWPLRSARWSPQTSSGDQCQMVALWRASSGRRFSWRPGSAGEDTGPAPWALARSSGGR
jgi:hypothetical protein